MTDQAAVLVVDDRAQIFPSRAETYAFTSPIFTISDVKMNH
jgi:hypothetical protein